MISPNAPALLPAGGKFGGIFPAPNTGNQFIGGNNSPTNLREEIIRVDHNFSSKFSVFGHFVDEAVSQTFGTSLVEYFQHSGAGHILWQPVLQRRRSHDLRHQPHAAERGRL